MKKRNQEQGFTLIELMSVIAVIGVLAAVALPAYQDYVGRAQAIEGLIATAGIRADMATYLYDNAVLPTVGDDAEIDTALATLDGRYFAAGGAVLDGAGQIAVTFNAGAHSGATLTMLAVNNGGQLAGWICGGLLPKYLPSSCQ